MTDGRCSGGVVRTAGARFVHLVFAALGRLIRVRRSLFLVSGVGGRGVGWIPCPLDAGSLYGLGITFRRFLGMYSSSLFAHRMLLVQRPSFDAFSFFAVSVPGPGSTITVYRPFQMKMVRKV
jgi:hypothetical protein